MEDLVGDSWMKEEGGVEDVVWVVMTFVGCFSTGGLVVTWSCKSRIEGRGEIFRAELKQTIYGVCTSDEL